jgi:hypothetical protein
MREAISLASVSFRNAETQQVHGGFDCGANE